MVSFQSMTEVFSMVKNPHGPSYPKQEHCSFSFHTILPKIMLEAATQMTVHMVAAISDPSWHQPKRPGDVQSIFPALVFCVC